MPDSTDLDRKEQKENHNIRKDYKTKLIQERIEVDEEELEEMGIHIKGINRRF